MFISSCQLLIVRDSTEFNFMAHEPREIIVIVRNRSLCCKLVM